MRHRHAKHDFAPIGAVWGEPPFGFMSCLLRETSKTALIHHNALHRWGQIPVNPSKFRNQKWGNILVSAASPLTNVLLGVFAVLIINSVLFFDWINIISLDFFYLIAKFNFALCLFNLIPSSPLDGFHIASEFSEGIKQLGKTQIGLALFVILFITGAGRVLFDIADVIVRTLII